MEAFLIGILAGVASGAIVSASGYLKNKPKYNFEGIDPVKAGRTVLIAAMIGGIIGGTGMEQELVVTVFEAMGITVIVENLLKSIYEKYVLK